MNNDITLFEKKVGSTQGKCCKINIVIIIFKASLKFRMEFLVLQHVNSLKKLLIFERNH